MSGITSSNSVPTSLTSAPKELSPVESALARLQGLQSSVGNVLGHLEQRLEPLLAPLGPAGDGAGRSPEAVPLVDAIHSQADTEAFTLERLRSLLERLAV